LPPTVKSLRRPLRFEVETPGALERRLVHVPIGRLAQAKEIAYGALFLASDESSYVNGSTFLVDGGITAAYVTPEKRNRTLWKPSPALAPIRLASARRRWRRRRLVGGSPAPHRQEEREQENRPAGAHENVSRRVELDPLEIGVDGKPKDRPDGDEDEGASEAAVDHGRSTLPECMRNRPRAARRLGSNQRSAGAAW
jgi:hypothetical protein